MAAGLPEDTIVYLATSGTEAIKPAFEASILGQIWLDPQVQQFYKDIKQAIIAKIGGSGEQELDDVLNSDPFRLAKAIIQKPIIVVINERDEIKTDDIGIYGFAMVDAGKQAGDIKEIITRLEQAELNDDPCGIVNGKIGGLDMQTINKDSLFVPYWGFVKDTFVCSVNDPNGLAVGYAGSENQKTHYGRLLNDTQQRADVIAGYVNIEKVMQFVKTQAQKDQVDKVQKVLDTLGLGGLESLTYRAGFDRLDMVAESWIQAPQPRGGLFEAIGPITPELFDMVDARAFRLIAVHCNLGTLYDVIMDTLKSAIDEDDFEQMLQAVDEFETVCQVEIRKDLLASMEGSMAMYQMAEGAIGPDGQEGFVLLAKLNDPAKMEQALSKLGEYAASQIDLMSQFVVNGKDGRTVYHWVIPSLAMMHISPCWTIEGDYLLLSSNLPLSKAAIEHISSPDRAEKSVRTKPGFDKLEQVPTAELIAVEYADSAVMFRQIINQLQAVWPMVTLAAGQGAGMVLPATLPAVDNEIVEKMGAAISYARLDDDGLYSYSKGPGQADALILVGGAGMGVSIMLPALARARELARRVKCAAQLRDCAVAMFEYQNEHDDKMPPDLKTLVDQTDFVEEMLICPSTPDDKQSYIYRGGDLDSTADRQMILMYEKPQNHQGQIRNVLFADGHVEDMTEEKFQRALQRDNELRKQNGLKYDSTTEGTPAKESGQTF